MVKDDCFVLLRFPVGDFSLLAKCYCRKFGRKNFLIPEYFAVDRKINLIGFFEPFNLLRVDFKEKNGSAVVEDASLIFSPTGEIIKNLERYFFLSKVSKTVLKFVKVPDEEIFELLKESLSIEDFFNFNLIRFWLNLSSLLGFSLKNLSRPGWVNLLTLKKCNPEELKNPYCVYISPREFYLIRRVLDSKVAPFRISNNDTKRLEDFFFKFLSHQSN